MSLLLGGTNDFGSNASAPLVLTYPFTVSLWFKRADFASPVTRTLWTIAAAATDLNYFSVLLASSGAAIARVRAGGALAAATTPNTVLDANWHHIMAVFASATSRLVYLDGGTAGTNATSVTPGTPTFTNVGTHSDGTQDFPGNLAHFAIHNSALSAANATSLAGGASPRSISGCIEYHNTLNPADVGNSDIGSYDWTMNGDGAYSTDNPVVGAAPAFDSALAVTSETAAAFTLGYDADARSEFLWTGAYLRGATAPTAAQIKAGTGAHGTAFEACTGSADSIVLTPSETTKFPIYDLYGALEGIGGFSTVAALTSKPLDPPTGKQFVTIDVPWPGGSLSYLIGASPAAVDGDITVCDTHVDSFALGNDAHVLTMGADGVPVVSPGADTSRLKFDAMFYDVDVGAYSDPAPVTHYINNIPPEFVGPSLSFLYPRSVAIPSLALEPLWDDAEGDALAVAFQDALPTGLSVAAEVLSGTPSVYGTTICTLRATDITGEYSEVDFEFIIGDYVPDVVDQTEASAIAEIESIASFVATVLGTAPHPTIAAGNVIAQAPSAGEVAPPDQEHLLLISTGPAGAAVDPDSSLQDAILAATGGPTVNDGLRSFYAAGGGTGETLQDLERSWLRIQTGLPDGIANESMWITFLVGEGYTGALSDMQLQFWLSGPSPSVEVLIGFLLEEFRRRNRRFPWVS